MQALPPYKLSTNHGDGLFAGRMCRRMSEEVQSSIPKNSSLHRKLKKGSSYREFELPRVENK